jgi:outer membrane lipoprotein-sorting protein
MQRTFISMFIFVLTFSVMTQPFGFADETGDRPDVDSIIAKVAETYQAMKSYSSTGEIITELDMSQIDPSSIPGMPQDEKLKDSPLMKASLQEKQSLKHEFEIYMSRSGDYRIEWDQQINALVNTHGVAWSKDKKYKVKMSSPMMNQPEMEQKDQMMNLATATGISGGAAHTVPALFYHMDNEILNSLQNKELLDDETVDAVDCFVITGKLMNQTMTLWIDKDRYVVLKRKQLIGENTMPEMSDEDVIQGLKAVNQEATPENIKKFKEQMKAMSGMMSKMKGEIVETHKDIKINPELEESVFEPKK